MIFNLNINIKDIIKILLYTTGTIIIAMIGFLYILPYLVNLIDTQSLLKDLLTAFLNYLPNNPIINLYTTYFIVTVVLCLENIISNIIFKQNGISFVLKLVNLATFFFFMSYFILIVAAPIIFKIIGSIIGK